MAEVTRAWLITLTLISVIVMVGSVTYKVFFDPVDVPSSTVNAFGILVGACGLGGMVELIKSRKQNK